MHDAVVVVVVLVTVLLVVVVLVVELVVVVRQDPAENPPQPLKVCPVGQVLHVFTK